MKEVFRYLKVFVFLIFVYITVSVLSCMIPNKKIHKNIARSVYKLEREGDYPHAINPQKQYQMDNFTDAMIINQIYSIDNSNPFESFLLVKHQVEGERTKVQALAWRVSHSKEPNCLYPRYWHGSTFLTRPLFLIGEFSQVRWILYAITSILFAIFCCTLYHKTNLIKTLAMVSGLVFVNFFVTQFSIQFSPVIILSLLSSILVCYKYPSRTEMSMLFFVFGSLTAYMDLLTVPLLTLGIPLTIFFILKEEDKILLSFKEGIKGMGLFSILWGVGYGFTWMTKWIMATLFTDINVIKDAFLTALYRMQSEAYLRKDFSRLDAVVLNADMLPWIYINSLLCVLLLLAVFFFKKEGLKNAFLFLIIALMPYIWYFLVANHSFLHWWFTYRAQAFSISCMLLAFVSVISWDKIREKVKIKKKGNIES